MKTHEKCWRLLTLRICFREKHRQILLGDFRKGLDITLCLKEQGKHSYCTWTGVKYSSQSQQMKRRAKHPRCPISAVYKELFLLVKTEKSFCFESQAGEQRTEPSRRTEKIGVFLGHQSLPDTAIPSAAPGPSDVPPAQRMPSLPGEKGISLLCRGSTSLMPNTTQPLPWCLCQQDPGAPLPLCPPASPGSPLLDAPLLSGSGSVDPGLASCVKDHYWGANPHPSSACRSMITSWYKPTTVTQVEIR